MSSSELEIVEEINNDDGTTTLVFEIEEPLITELKEYAEKNNITVEDVIRAALIEAADAVTDEEE